MPTTESQKRLTTRIRDLTNEVIAGTDYFLVELNVRGHRGTRVVEIYIDGDDGIGHDDLAVISREVGFLLDVEDVVDGGYTLDVSSPGIKRPLKLPRQFQKNVGHTLRVRHQPDGEDEEIHVGDLVEADDDGIVLELASDERIRMAYDDLNEARFELPW